MRRRVVVEHLRPVLRMSLMRLNLTTIPRITANLRAGIALSERLRGTEGEAGQHHGECADPKGCSWQIHGGSFVGFEQTTATRGWPHAARGFRSRCLTDLDVADREFLHANCESFQLRWIVRVRALVRHIRTPRAAAGTRLPEVRSIQAPQLWSQIGYEPAP